MKYLIALLLSFFSSLSHSAPINITASPFHFLMDGGSLALELKFSKNIAGLVGYDSFKTAQYKKNVEKKRVAVTQVGLNYYFSDGGCFSSGPFGGLRAKRLSLSENGSFERFSVGLKDGDLSVELLGGLMFFYPIGFNVSFSTGVNYVEASSKFSLGMELKAGWLF